MRHVTSLRWLCAIVLSSCFAMHAQAQGFGFDTMEPSTEVAPTPEGGVSVSDNLSGLSETTLAETRYGQWIWTEDFNDTLDEAVVVLPDATDWKTLYAGGNGFIRVSHDNGETWKNAVTFRGGVGVTDENHDDMLSKLSDEEIISAKREFILNEITSTYDSNFAESIDADITDEELLLAETTDDIDIFSQYELDIESDLMRAFDAILVEDVSDDGDDVRVEHSDFVTRYTKLLDMGADEESALERVSAENAVWQMITRAGRTWALTSESLYETRDKGETWGVIPISSGGGRFISFDVSESGNRITVATTEGFIVSEDGGATWKQASGVTEGVPYKLTHTRDGLLVVATPQTVYVSSDACETLIPMNNFVVPAGDRIVDVSTGRDALILIATETVVRGTRDLVTFHDVDVSALYGAPLRQVNSLDGTESHLLVRSDDCVYVLRDGTWFRQVEGLFGDVTHHVELWPGNKANVAILVTESSVLVAAKDRKSLNDEGQYDLLKRQWAKEPTPQRIVEQALAVHALDTSAHDKYKARLWTSMLLPNARFVYDKRQQATNRATTNSLGDSGAITGRAWDQMRDTTSYWEFFALWNFDLGKRQREEILIDQYSYNQNRSRASLIKQVETTIKKRYTKQMSLLKRKSPNAKSELKHLLDIQELDARLYYLTGGFFDAKSYK